MSTYLLMRGDGEIEEVLEGDIPDVVNQIEEILPRHTQVYFDGDIHIAFEEYYAAREAGGESFARDAYRRAANPLPGDVTREWDGPDEAMPQAALQASGLRRVTKEEIDTMTEEQAYERLRLYFVDTIPKGWPATKGVGSYGSWGKLTGHLLGENYKTMKAATPANLEKAKKKQDEAEKKAAQAAKDLARKNAQRAKKGLKPLKPRKVPEKKPVMRYSPETGGLEKAPSARSKGLQLLPHVGVQGHAFKYGPRSEEAIKDRQKRDEAEGKVVSLATWKRKGAALLDKEQLRNFGVCIGSSSGCRASCLVMTGQNEAQEWNKIVKGVRTEALIREPVAFLKALYEAVGKHRDACNRSGQLCFVRLNIYSDIPWELVCPELFAEYPDVMFYDYTKIAGRDVSAIPNYHLTFSFSGTELNRKRMWREYRNRGRQIALVFNLPKTVPFEGMTFHGERIFDGDLHDIRNWEPSPAVIGLHYKLPKKQVPFELRTEPTTRMLRLKKEAAKELPKLEERELTDREKIYKAQLEEAVAQVKALKSLQTPEKRRRSAAWAEQSEERQAELKSSYFLVPCLRDPDTGIFLMAVTPRLIGADDYEEISPPVSPASDVHASALIERDAAVAGVDDLVGNDGGDDTLS